VQVNEIMLGHFNSTQKWDRRAEAVTPPRWNAAHYITYAPAWIASRYWSEALWLN